MAKKAPFQNITWRHRKYTSELSSNWMDTNGFKVKMKNEWLVAVSSCRQNLNFGDFTLLF